MDNRSLRIQQECTTSRRSPTARKSSRSIRSRYRRVMRLLTAVDWPAKLEVNGEEISQQNIGVRSLDHKNQVSTFTFVGISLRPGPNRVRVSPISPDGVRGQAQNISYLGRGPARRLEIVSEKSEIQSGGSDSTMVRVKAFDQWGNPAADGQVGIESSLGQLQRSGEKPSEISVLPSNIAEKGDAPNTAASRQTVVQLVGGEAVVRLTGSGAPGEAKLHAQTGEIEAQGQVRITTEQRSTIMVGFAEMSFG